MRYLFINYCIDNSDLSLKYCPTWEMYSDFFTKPLQRKTFQQFRDIKQVIPKITLDVDISFPRAVDNVTPQESVGQNDRQTHKIATASTYAHRIMCTDKQKIGIKSKDDLRNHVHRCLRNHTHGRFYWEYRCARKHVLVYLYWRYGYAQSDIHGGFQNKYGRTRENECIWQVREVRTQIGYRYGHSR